MGECTSRPSNQELEQHIQEMNSKNDIYFRYIPLHTLTKEHLQSEKNLHTLESKIKVLKRKKQDFTSKLESANHGISSIPELNIEIQKGINLLESGLCWTQGKPYVLVSLEPNGPKYETFESNIYRPYWYKLIQFKQTIPYAKIVIRVMAKKNYGADVCLGLYEIKISEVNDQMVKEGWFNLESSGNATPSIRIRVQYIFDEKKLLEDIVGLCDEKIFVIEEVVRKIHDASHNSS